VMPLEDLLEAADRRRALGFRVCSTSPPACLALRDEQGIGADPCLAGQGSVRSACLRALRPTSTPALRPALSLSNSGARSRA